ncbi:MAG TPA: hypothetical protein VHZ32_03210 [Rhizomicrobium sp.]|nr:hypothetical protein [Rhizomicrobium sp.]
MTNANRIAKCMFMVSTVLTSMDGLVALYRSDYLTGLLGISAALASAAGAIVTDSASRLQDQKQDT